MAEPYESPCYCTNLRRAAKAVSDFYEEGLRPAGLTAAQYHLLVNIERVEPTSTAQLARHIGLERSTLVRTVEVLRKNGWVHDATLGPRHAFELTGEGRGVLASAKPLWAEVQRRFEQRMGAREAETLMELSKRVQNLNRPPTLSIRFFERADEQALVELVLHCQNDGTRPLVTVDDQPELLRIEELYGTGAGGFWVAEDDGALAGSIGLLDCGEGVGILKKFFTYERYRSAPHHLGRQLYDVLLSHARSHGFRMLYLDTPKNTERAHKFYAKAGWQPVDEADLPFAYDHPYRDSDFFRLDLEG